LHHAEDAARLEHAEGIFKRGRKVAALLLEAREVVQCPDEQHHVSLPFHLSRHRADVERVDGRRTTGLPRFHFLRPVGSPGPHRRGALGAAVAPLWPHRPAAVGAAEAAVPASVRDEDLRAPARTRHSFMYGHARYDTEKFDRLTRVP